MDTKPEKPAPQNAENQDVDVKVDTGGKSDPARGLKVTPPGDAAGPQSATSSDENVQTDSSGKGTNSRIGKVKPQGDR